MALPEWLNIAELFLTRRLAEGRGGRTALRLADSQLTYAELDSLANRFGNLLRDLGVRQEERVVLSLPDSAEYAAALFGILKIGAVAVMVNPALGSDGLSAMVDLARARVAVVAPDAAPSVRHRVVVVTGDGPHLDCPAELEAARTHRDDPAIWLFSGGTTGRPKAAVQTHGSFANTTELYARRAMGWNEDDVTLSVPKLYFGYATGSNLFFPLSVGGSAALFPEHPTPEVLAARIERHRPTILINTPKMVAAMIDLAGSGGTPLDLSCLRFATSAGEALPPSLYDRWKETFGVELYDGLGTAEMWHVFVSNQPGAVRPGSLGKVVEGFELAVRDADGRDVPEGEVGRLWVRGGSRALWYWQDEPRSHEAFRGEWFAGGDLVRRDADGFVHYVGRGDDALKVGGKWLLPAEVEDCLLTHDAVTEAAVVGVPDATGLIRPVAFVVPAGPDGDAADDGALGSELQQHCLAHLDAYKHPRRVFVLADLPRTHLGKVDRGALRRLADGRL
ncbi:MAG TPA: benzoate-CoA ligase family protein [Acidimicrobiia bacterium]|nr:benzoate-CoA ligase family protein [Acidimicrobiia bacterium]